jgi:hypothetical protein
MIGFWRPKNLRKRSALIDDRNLFDWLTWSAMTFLRIVIPLYLFVGA